MWPLSLKQEPHPKWCIADGQELGILFRIPTPFRKLFLLQLNCAIQYMIHHLHYTIKTSIIYGIASCCPIESIEQNTNLQELRFEALLPKKLDFQHYQILHLLRHTIMQHLLGSLAKDTSRSGTYPQFHGSLLRFDY